MLAVFQFLAVLCCTLFAGAAIYISLVEHPREWAATRKPLRRFGLQATKGPRLCRLRWLA